MLTLHQIFKDVFLPASEALSLPLVHRNKYNLKSFDDTLPTESGEMLRVLLSKGLITSLTGYGQKNSSLDNTSAYRIMKRKFDAKSRNQFSRAINQLKVPDNLEKQRDHFANIIAFSIFNNVKNEKGCENVKLTETIEITHKDIFYDCKDGDCFRSFESLLRTFYDQNLKNTVDETYSKTLNVLSISDLPRSQKDILSLLAAMVALSINTPGSEMENEDSLNIAVKSFLSANRANNESSLDDIDKTILISLELYRTNYAKYGNDYDMVRDIEKMIIQQLELANTETNIYVRAALARTQSNVSELSINSESQLQEVL